MRTSEKLKTELESLIGKEAYTADDNLNKAVIAQFLLRSEENAKAIDNIVHPAVAEDFLSSGYDWNVPYCLSRDSANWWTKQSLSLHRQM